MRERVCKNCGGRAYKIVGQNMVKCMFCGTLYVDEHASKEEVVLVVGANEILRELRFDDAVEEFNKILSLYPRSFESFYGKALAKNKIVFYNSGRQKRPRFFGETIPSILEDEDFKHAVELAPTETQKEYNEQAKRIEKLSNAYKELKTEYDVVVLAPEYVLNDTTSLTSKAVENFKHDGLSVYLVSSSEKDKEEETFKALKTCKAMVVFANAQKGYSNGDIKNVYDRYLYFISQKEKAKTSLIVAFDETKIKLNALPKDLASCKSVVDMNSISFLQDINVKVKNEMAKTVDERAKLETVKLDRATPERKEYVNLESVKPTDLGNYHVENVELSDTNKIKWIFLTLKHGDFQSAQELINEELEKDPNNAEILFAQMMTKRNIKTQEEFFANISNFNDKETIDKILTFASKDFAEFFVDSWENLIISLDNEEYYNLYLIYLAGFNTKNRENFIAKAESKAIETLNEELIGKVLKCFDNTQVDRFINFYFMLAQKSDNQEYYKKILELDAGHEQSNLAVLLQHFKNEQDILNYSNKEEVENVFKYLSDTSRTQFVTTVVNMILPIAFCDLEKAQQQLDFYLSYVSDNESLTNILKNIAISFQEKEFFKVAERYVSIAISKTKDRADLYWLLIQIKAHCKNDQELIMSSVKISQMPEWETLVSLSDDAQKEKFAEIMSKNNLYQGEKQPFRPDRLDKKQLTQKLSEFVLRNQNILLEMEKQNLTSKSIEYFKLQLKPFENYINQVPHIKTFDEFLELLSKIEDRLQALDLNLDASINVTNLTEKESGLKKIFQTKQENEVKRKESIKNIKRDMFLKRFIFIFLEICPLAFTSILFLILIFAPKEVYLYFNSTFLSISLIYCVVVGMGNFLAYILKKQTLSKNWKIGRLALFSFGILNLILFGIGHLNLKAIEIDSAGEFNKLLHNAPNANYRLVEDIDMSNISWHSINFSGTLDGQGHSLQNLKFSGDNNLGLFSRNSGQIENLSIFLAETSYSDIRNFGGVSALNFGNIENCQVFGTVSFELQEDANIGGISAISEGGTISDCLSSVNIKIDASVQRVVVGGLVGELRTGKTTSKVVKNVSHFTLEIVEADAENVFAGGSLGYVGHIQDVDISENESNVNFSFGGRISNLVAGGLVGQGYSQSQNNFSTGQIFASSVIGSGYLGGLYGQYENANLANRVSTSYSLVEFDESSLTTGSLIGGFGGAMENCFSNSEIQLVGQRKFSSTSEVNCLQLTQDFYDASLGFDEEIWNISSSDYPTLNKETV